jgi:hypothetical protein
LVKFCVGRLDQVKCASAVSLSKRRAAKSPTLIQISAGMGKMSMRVDSFVSVPPLNYLPAGETEPLKAK